MIGPNVASLPALDCTATPLILKRHAIDRPRRIFSCAAMAHTGVTVEFDQHSAGVPSVLVSGFFAIIEPPTELALLGKGAVAHTNDAAAAASPRAISRSGRHHILESGRGYRVHVRGKPYLRSVPKQSGEPPCTMTTPKFPVAVVESCAQHAHVNIFLSRPRSRTVEP
nr:hypothetical protein CFP56_04091 [Quercus suber]